MKPLSDDQRRQIFELRAEGLTYGEIAKRIGCSRQTVYNRVKEKEVVRQTDAVSATRAAYEVCKASGIDIRKLLDAMGVP